ncbi:hypothetical protein A2V49_01515 [candidate division WWE3 bacterium RBG_19FT_COMBO_34_6]|uniref:DUF5655 domain-containing protein n=1 Tax=candidate division WWE3 bacterium RBG_19FT_COMBO_34_6 TaxID=1802612 RepID=A0A1F4UKC3_UNCKA|nr:MAG: hypothetical protein A2V49_01515 [candidate division WWE3 bacterium RBG_19FT_COMBO_34_6]
MWTCPRCKRIFKKIDQPHSCKQIPLEEHFQNKLKARDIFNCLVEQINNNIGEVKIISIPCCIHLYGKYDFLAALPKKECLEVRFALDRKLDTSRLKQCVPMSSKIYKNCIDVFSKEEIDDELINFLKESYHLKN